MGFNVHLFQGLDVDGQINFICNLKFILTASLCCCSADVSISPKAGNGSQDRGLFHCLQSRDSQR